MTPKEAFAKKLRSRVPSIHNRHVTDSEMIDTFGGFPTREEVQRWLNRNRLKFRIEFSPTLPGWHFRKQGSPEKKPGICGRLPT